MADQEVIRWVTVRGQKVPIRSPKGRTPAARIEPKYEPGEGEAEQPESFEVGGFQVTRRGDTYEVWAPSHRSGPVCTISVVKGETQYEFDEETGRMRIVTPREIQVTTYAFNGSLDELDEFARAIEAAKQVASQVDTSPIVQEVEPGKSKKKE